MKKTIKLTLLSLLVTLTAVAEDYSGLYRLKSRYNNFAQEDASTHAMSAASSIAANDMKQLWIVEKQSNAYTIRNAYSGRYIPDNGGSDQALVTTPDPVSFYIKTSAADDNYLTISWNSTYAGATCLHENAGHKVVKWFANNESNENPYSDWQLVSLTELDTLTTANIRRHLGEINGIATTVTNGYYRIVPTTYPDRSLTEDISAAAAITMPTNDNDLTQIWYLTNNNDTITIQNAVSQYYLRNNLPNNLQLRTTPDNANNTFTLSLSELSQWEPAVVIKGRFTGVSCGASPNYKVVGGVTSKENAQWQLYKVDVDPDALTLARIETMDVVDITRNAATYTTKLQTYFSDHACTSLRDEYAAMSADQLRSAMEADRLPYTLREMAVKILTDQWDADATRSKYVKMFRIQDVSIYSSNTEWKTITKVGPWAELINPTGIQGKTGDVVFIYADANPKDNDASLVAQLAYDTEFRNKGTLPLKQGLNVWTLPADGEIFIGYTLNNPSRYLSEYPDIRIHIERGTVNGYWDLSRGMTNNDWKWLKNNMFDGEFLHVKGKSTVLNLIKSKVVGATDVVNIMKGWDYAFESLEYLIGNDGQWEGRYRPVVNPRHSYKGNPNWPGYGGSNHPDINSNYLFNYSNFYEGNIWEITHELGHGNQYPINIAGATEISNNSLAQMVSFMMGRNYSRGDGTEKLVQMFNYERNGLKGWSWTDYSRYADPFYDASLHVGNHLLYQLYLYFEVLGHSPGFMPRLCNELRSNPIKMGSSVSSPTYYYNDYWRLAEACAKVSNTDLWEFFEVYGFWKYYDEVISTRDQDDSDAARQAGIRFIGDYGNYYMKMPVRGNADDEKRLADLKAYMHSLPNKASNVMFLDDRINPSFVRSNCFVAQVKRALIGQPLLHYWNIPSQGDFGHYTYFDGKDRSANLGYTIGTTIDTQDMSTSKGGEWNYTISGRTVTMKGSGILGIKIYDDEGKLCHIANTRQFIIPEDMAEALEEGTYSLHVATLAGHDVVFDSQGNPTGVNSVDGSSEGNAANQPVRDLFGRIVDNPVPGNIYIRGKQKFIAH
ncbi:MAG: M60 family metallopeptidase [Prevotellaceae bacterium]|nr:M60 family metallopeptidase [Prevotellaceae bacterium]